MKRPAFCGAVKGPAQGVAGAALVSPMQGAGAVTAHAQSGRLPHSTDAQRREEYDYQIGLGAQSDFERE